MTHNMRTSTSTGGNIRRPRFARAALALALVALLVAVCTVAVACNPGDNEDKAAAERAAACEALRVNALASISDGWADGLTDAQIVALPDAGKYVVAENWVRSLSGFIGDSDLQTAKIQRLADFLATDEGKATVRDISGNLGGVISILNSVGFTSADAQSLVYNGLIFLVDEAQNIYRSARDELAAIASRVTGEAYASVTEQLGIVDNVLEVYENNGAAVKNATASIAAAEQGIKALVDFSYRSAWIFAGGDRGESLGGLFGVFSSGALADISDREAFLYLDSILNGLLELGNSLTDAQIAALADALESLENLLETAVLPVELFEETGTGTTTRLDTLIKDIDGIQFAVDWMQDGTDWLYSALSLLYEKDGSGEYTYRFVRRIKEALADEEYADYNAVILFCEVLANALKEIPVGDLQAKILSYSSSDDLDKLSVLSLVSGYFRLLDALEGEGSEIEPDDDIDYSSNNELLIVMRVYALKAFKASYRTYLATEDVKNSKICGNNTRILVEYIGKEDEGLTQNGDGHGEITQVWYEGIVNAATAKLTEDMAQLKNGILSNLASVIAGWYDDVAFVEDVAATAFFTADSTAEDIAAFEERIAALPVWLRTMFMLIIGGK